MSKGIFDKLDHYIMQIASVCGRFCFLDEIGVYLL